MWCSLSLFRSFFCLPWGPQNRITTRETPTNRKRAALKWRRQPQSGDDRPEVVTTGPEVATTVPEVATSRHRSGDDQAQKWRRPAQKWRRPGPEVATNRGFFRLVPRFSSPKWRRPVFSRIYWDRSLFRCLRLRGGFWEALGRIQEGFWEAASADQDFPSFSQICHKCQAHFNVFKDFLGQKPF